MSIEQETSVKTAIHKVGSAVDSGHLTEAAGQNLIRWLRESYFAEYRQQLMGLVDQSQFAELNQIFWERIPFGTGGRRGPMSEFGSATINTRTIAESANGLAVYVARYTQSKASKRESDQTLRAVIARDTRNRSMEFARLTAEILAARGFQVYFFTEPRSTPELSFAVRHLSCDTGVMISASHNPPSDNGFKAYWNSGGQVLPPHDTGIIECVDASQEIPRLNFDAAVRSGQIFLLSTTSDPSSVDMAYIKAVSALSLNRSREIRALYTPMHGVGESSIFQVLQFAGFSQVELYEAQRSQDGDFPNVPDHLPNPERSQALVPAIEFAKRNGHELVLASDPDADRLAVAVRTRDEQFVCLTGNQLGALLADYVLSKRRAAGTISPDHFLVETLVTTPLLESIGMFYGVRVIRDLLVGFKYIAAAIDANGPDKFLFAAEESVGYLAGEYCRDKDASIAALFALEMASELRENGQTLADRLDEIYIRHGVYHETQFVQVCPGPEGREEISQMMESLRDKAPRQLGPVTFSTVRDYKKHEVRSVSTPAVIAPIPHPSGDLLILEGQSNDCTVSLAGRPSGTEPKIKFYLFANASPNLPLDEAKKAAKTCLADLELALKQWLVHK